MGLNKRPAYEDYWTSNDTFFLNTVNQKVYEFN